jgi:alkylation response protein AidB-like acyl-CoA dehydrogenase
LSSSSISAALEELSRLPASDRALLPGQCPGLAEYLEQVPDPRNRRERRGCRRPARKARAESMLIPAHPTARLLAQTAPRSTIFTIFEGTSEIQRMIIGRAVTGLDVR